MWPSVRRGEEENIFPYQDSADTVFNSALIYETALLKPYVEPLLFGVPHDCPEYLEAKRLLKFLNYFLPLPADNVPKTSLLREFVGGLSAAPALFSPAQGPPAHKPPPPRIG